MPLAVNEMDDEYLARLRLSQPRSAQYVSLAHRSHVVVAPLSSRPRFLMPSAFVRRANPKFGVEKEEGGRKGVIFRGNVKENKRWRRVLPCITWADSLRLETALTLPTSDKHIQREQIRMVRGCVKFLPAVA